MKSAPPRSTAPPRPCACSIRPRARRRPRRRAPTRRCMAPTIRCRAIPFADKVRAVRRDRRRRPRPRPAGRPGQRRRSPRSWSVIDIVRADGFVASDIRPLVRLNISIVAKQGDRRETGTYGIGGRYLYDRLFDPATWNRGDRHGARPGAGESGNRSPRRRARCRWCAAPAGPACCSTKRSATGSKAISTARAPRLSRAGSASASPRPGVTVVDEGAIEGRRGIADHRRRRHADRPHRADRGRHLEGLSPGPPQRPADGDAADRQRPPRKLRPCADAAHDQHLHARRQRRSGRARHPRQGRHLRQELRRRAGRHHQRASSSSPAPRPIASAAARSPSRSRARP